MPETLKEPQLPPRFQAIEEIAQGAMGAVWKVHDGQFDRLLAVKVMLPDRAVEHDARLRFEREAEITGGLQHPAIPPVVDRGILADETPYFSMKLVEGRTLADLLDTRADSVDDRSRFLAIFEQLCQAVGYAHSQGIIHRDLKPANVMVGAFGEVQVMDWGMAKRIREEEGSNLDPQNIASPNTPLDPEGDTVEYGGSTASETGDGVTRAGTIMGTLAYMPPEQARGELDRLAPPSDVFALGAILCEILTGERPYAKPDLWQKVSSGALQPAYDRLDESETDRELAALCKRCLAKAMDDRPADGSAVANEIAAYRRSVEQRLNRERAERAAAEVRAVEERKRRRVSLLLAASVLLLICGGGGAAWWYQQDRIAKETAAVINSKNAETEIETLLTRSRQLRDRYDFRTAGALLAQAEARLEDLLDPAGFSDKLNQARKELAIVQKIDAIRFRKTQMGVSGEKGVSFGNGRNGAFAKAFRDYGIDIFDKSSAEVVGAKIARSPIKQALLAGLDDWALYDPELRGRILAVAQAADDDPLMRKLRDPSLWKDREALRAMAREAVDRTLPASTLVSLSNRLHRVQEWKAASDVLRRCAVRNPNDFWTQYFLGVMLSASPDRQRNAAAGYFRAAIAIRPDNAASYYGLAAELYGKNIAEAEIAIRRALELSPDTKQATFHQLLGLVLKRAKRPEDAEQAFRKAISVDPQLPPAHFQLGRVLELQQRPREAEAAYRKAIAADKSYAAAHAALGRLLNITGDLKGAEEAHRTAIRLNPKKPSFHHNYGVWLEKRKRFAEAKAAIGKALELDPDLAKAHLVLGVLLIRERNWKEAEASLNRAIDSDPKLVEALVRLGAVCRLTGRPKEAEAHYRRAIQIDPDHGPAYVALAAGFMGQKRNEEAVKYFRIGLEKGFDSASLTAGVQYNFGRFLESLKRFEEAETAYRKAVDLNPKLLLAHVHMARSLEKRGRLPQAETAYRKAVASNPKSSVAHYLLATFLRKTNRLKEAEQAFRTTIALNPKHAKACLNLGTLLGSTNRPQEAEKLLRKAIELDPKNAIAHANLGAVLTNAKKFREAETVLRHAIELDPKSGIGHTNLGVLLTDLRRFEEAEPVFLQAIRVNPKSSLAYHNYGRMLSLSNRFREAEAAMRTAMKLDPNHRLTAALLGGMLLRSSNRIDEATALFESARSSRDERTRRIALLGLKMVGRYRAKEKRLIAIRSGKTGPASVTEALALAEFALVKKAQPWLAAKLYLTAFRQKSLPARVRVRYQYNAACAMLLVVDGKAEKGVKVLDDKEKSTFRTTAHLFLKADLAAWKRAIASSEKGRKSGLRQMRHWRNDPDLAGVRGDDAIGRLPAAEREQWRTLWNEVESIVRSHPVQAPRPRPATASR